MPPVLAQSNTAIVRKAGLMRFLLHASLGCVFLLALTGRAMAALTASLRGHVSDENGLPVPGA